MVHSRRERSSFTFLQTKFTDHFQMMTMHSSARQHHTIHIQPYSASKASSDMLVKAYMDTYKFPANITNCSNNYGPYQFPEKLIPLIINNALQGKDLPVYGDGKKFVTGYS